MNSRDNYWWNGTQLLTTAISIDECAILILCNTCENDLGLKRKREESNLSAFGIGEMDKIGQYQEHAWTSTSRLLDCEQEKKCTGLQSNKSVCDW